MLTRWHWLSPGVSRTGRHYLLAHFTRFGQQPMWWSQSPERLKVATYWLKLTLYSTRGKKTLNIWQKVIILMLTPLFFRHKIIGWKLFSLKMWEAFLHCLWQSYIAVEKSDSIPIPSSLFWRFSSGSSGDLPSVPCSEIPQGALVWVFHPLC